MTDTDEVLAQLGIKPTANQLMAQLLVGHMIQETRQAITPTRPTIEAWYDQQPYEKIDPKIAHISSYMDENGDYRVTFDGEQDGKEITISTLTMRAKTADVCDQLIAAVSRAMPCMPIETSEGFIYPCFSESKARAIQNAETRRKTKADKLAEQQRRTREGQNK